MTPKVERDVTPISLRERLMNMSSSQRHWLALAVSTVVALIFTVAGIDFLEHSTSMIEVWFIGMVLLLATYVIRDFKFGPKIKMAMLVAVFGLLLVFNHSTARAQSVSGGGIPVFDVATATQAVALVNGQIKQIQHAVETVNGIKQTIDAMTGGRAIGAILNGMADQQGRRWLPDDMQAIGELASAATTTYTALQTTIRNTRALISSLPVDFFPTGSDARRILDQQLNQISTQKAMGDYAYANVTKQVSRIEQLIGENANTADTKAAIALQTRVNAEQALIQNETNRQLALIYQQNVEAQIRSQQAWERKLVGERAGIPSIRD